MKSPVLVRITYPYFTLLLHANLINARSRILISLMELIQTSTFHLILTTEENLMSSADFQ
jgi:hypothetical protein